MRCFVSLFIASIIGSASAQTTVFLEDFSGYPNPTLQNPPNWTTVAVDMDDPALNQGNYWGTFNGEFRCNDVEGPGNNNLNYLTTRYVQITGLGSIRLSVDYRHQGTMECGCGPNCEDRMTFSYSLDGGPWILFSQNGIVCGSNGSPGQAEQNCLQGDSIALRISMGNQANAENYYIDNLLMEALSAPPISAGPDTFLCAGNSIQLLASGGTGYQWVGPSLSCTACANPNAQPFQSSWYVLQGMDAIGCTQTDSAWVQITGNPNAQLDPDTIICSGQQVVLGPLPDSLTHYLWNTGDTTAQISIATSGWFFLEASNACGSDSDSVQVDVQPGPTAALPPDTTVCHTDFPIALWAGNADAFLWNTGNTTDSLLAMQAGWYSVQLFSACGLLADSVWIMADSLPSPNLGPDTNLCLQSPLMLDPGYAAPQTLWSNGNTSPQLWVENPGWYWVSLTNGCGTATDSVWVEDALGPQPTVNDTLLLCNQDSIQILVLDSSLQLLWPNNSQQNSFWISEPGTYSVSLTRCQQTLVDSFSVSLQSSADGLKLPNVFSPNNDGVNDMYQIPFPLDAMDFWVYNRWGQLLFHGNNALGWDGGNAPEGVYQVVAAWNDPCTGAPSKAQTAVHLFR